MKTLTWVTSTLGAIHWTVPDDEVAEKVAHLGTLGYTDVTIEEN